MYSGNTFRFIIFYTNLEYLSNFSTHEYISLCDGCLVKMPITVFSDLIGSLMAICGELYGIRFTFGNIKDISTILVPD